MHRTTSYFRGERYNAIVVHDSSVDWYYAKIYDSKTGGEIKTRGIEFEEVVGFYSEEFLHKSSIVDRTCRQIIRQEAKRRNRRFWHVLYLELKYGLAPCEGRFKIKQKERLEGN